jgi:thiol-disulfide isomerase/thioredoxin
MPKPGGARYNALQWPDSHWFCRSVPTCHHDGVTGMNLNHSWLRWPLLVLFLSALAGTIFFAGQGLLRRPTAGDGIGTLEGRRDFRLASFEQDFVPSFRGGVEWINSGPITFPELRGKIVLLDFWTYCCINCHHVLLDLAKLEEKYKNELVVIGVHTAKFDAERSSENIRRKVAEYRIKHPVVNDAKQAIWNRFGVNSWPTLVLLDVRGNVVGAIPGEGHYDVLDREIGQLVDAAKARGELNTTPFKFSPEMERPVKGPLLYPGKVFADAAGQRLFIADTGHNRIIQTDLDGKKPVTIGSGEEGFEDGGFDKATFNRPQGMFLSGDTLYVADTENHAIRAVDLKELKVTTVAGTGAQANRVPSPGASGPAKTSPLCSPWDLIQIQDDPALYIAMAGPHQIWKLDLATEVVSVFAGSGYEDIQDGTAPAAKFAQPSGLATDGVNIFVADSEVSGVRVITGIHGNGPVVHTIVGEGLFQFGDRDGRGAAVRLQHCLGLAYARDHLYIADTYNNKVKVCEPKVRSVKTLVGSHQPGESDDPPSFYQPGGLSAAGERLFVADTNNHKIRVVDLKSHAVTTMALDDLAPPRLAPKPPSFPNAKTFTVTAAQALAGKSIEITVTVPLAKGLKLNEEAPATYLVETPGASGILSAEVPREGTKVKPQVPKLNISVPLAKAATEGEKIELKISLMTLVCNEKSNLCQIKSYIWDVPITFVASGAPERLSLSGDTD